MNAGASPAPEERRSGSEDDDERNINCVYRDLPIRVDGARSTERILQWTLQLGRREPASRSYRASIRSERCRHTRLNRIVAASRIATREADDSDAGQKKFLRTLGR